MKYGFTGFAPLKYKEFGTNISIQSPFFCLWMYIVYYQVFVKKPLSCTGNDIRICFFGIRLACFDNQMQDPYVKCPDG